MNDLFNILFKAAFVENLALVFLLGMCTYLAVSKNVETAFGLGLAVIVVETITVPINFLIFKYVLSHGALDWAGFPQQDLSHLKIIMFIGVIAATVQILEMVLERFYPVLFKALGVYLPLLTVNCAILGASLFMVHRNYLFSESVVYGFGVGLGWAIAIVVFAAIRERLDESKVPKSLRGLGLAFIVSGMLSLSFNGLAGLEF
jgi:Na+-transporting NADH:ubiquinone oxidoreductase subunit E